MDDSFRIRVDKIFGSLSSSSSPNLNSLWSLTDDEIEKNEWNRAKEEPEPEPKSFFANVREKNKTERFGEGLEKDLLDLDDGLDDEAEARDSQGLSSRSGKADDYNDEEWEIKCNIGLDCTLDYEEEEDQFDKVASSEEKTGDHIYMKDVIDYVTDADCCDELPDSVKDFSRDPRANHVAAKIRLKEDAEAAKKIGSLRVSEQCAPSFMDAKNNSEEDCLKPILKRGDNPSDSKPKKRVRFDSECKDSFDENTHREEAIISNEAFTSPPDYPTGIPDYMRNPSKYTRYTFDSDDIDDNSNAQAYMDFFKMLKKNTTELPVEDDSRDLPKTVTFIPKRKTGDATMTEYNSKSKDDTGKESVHKRGLPVGIPAADVEDDEVCAMDEDEPESKVNKTIGSQKSGRQYRRKVKSDME
ncbi:uncharacterized protein LOC123222438 [Mangifera indica]|uniref:uncharacterized protein LOC123222438 n=1 Tax=Mangifera indica TaxID=29780 RepID=UPI001CFA6FDE|nr:uncharacterized protein LOC123222438 [Mangifera indica]